MDLGENLMAHQTSLVMIGGGLRSAPSSLSSREMFLVVWGLFTGHRRPWVWLKSLGLMHKTEDVGNHVHIRFAEYFKNIMFEIFWVSYINSLSIRLGGSSWFRPHPRAIAPWLCLVVLSMDELKDALKKRFWCCCRWIKRPLVFLRFFMFPSRKRAYSKTKLTSIGSLAQPPGEKIPFFGCRPRLRVYGCFSTHGTQKKPWLWDGRPWTSRTRRPSPQKSQTKSWPRLWQRAGIWLLVHGFSHVFFNPILIWDDIHINIYIYTFNGVAETSPRLSWRWRMSLPSSRSPTRAWLSGVYTRRKGCD